MPFLALFWPARRRHCPALTLGMNCTKLGSLGFSTIPRHSTRIKRWKRENTSISRLAWFWCSFGAFSAGTKTTLSWAYPWNKLQQTRFLGLLQAIPPESGVGNEKIPVLADCPCFAPWSNFWQFFGRLEDDDVLHLPLDRIAPNSVPMAFARHSTGI